MDRDVGHRPRRDRRIRARACFTRAVAGADFDPFGLT
jgi:hypothetical protein